MACCTVVGLQGWPISTVSVRRARTGVAATPPTPMAAASTRPPSSCSDSARQTVEMSSSTRFDTL